MAPGRAPAYDPKSGLVYVNSNEMARLRNMMPGSDESVFVAACANGHGADRKRSAAGPSLFGVMLDGATVNDLVNFLVTGEDVAKSAGTNPFYLKYRSIGFDIFLDHEGYPGVKPPWGTLNAIDLNKGEIRWTIPFGEYPKLAAQGIKNPGTDNYGGAIVTENGLLIIAATTYDNKIRA